MPPLDRAIVEIVESVCSSVLGLSIVEAIGPGAAAGTTGLTARTTVEGAWSGAVVVRCDRAFADACAAILFEGEPCGPAEARDALGELTNIIAGNLKALLPSPSQLSLPMVGGDEPVELVGADHNLDHVRFEVAGQHRLEVVLHAHDGGDRR